VPCQTARAWPARTERPLTGDSMNGLSGDERLRRERDWAKMRRRVEELFGAEPGAFDPIGPVKRDIERLGRLLKIPLPGFLNGFRRG